MTPDTLVTARLIKNTKIDIKILGSGELTKKLSVSAHGFSKTAKEKIEAAGGTVSWLRGEPVEKKPKRSKAKAPVASDEVDGRRRGSGRRGGNGRSRRGAGRVMLSWLGNAWRVPELRRRVLFTAFVLAVYRLGSWMPAPGVDSAAIQSYFNGNGGSILGLLSLFSGGALSRFSLFALGIMPYVTASIIVQLLTVVIPRLAELQKEGEAGYAKINQYTRYLTVVLAALQAFGYAVLFQRQDALQANAGRMTLIVVTLTTGTVLLMWLGEQITKRGIGNGISILIFASILTSLPLGISAWWNGGPMERIFFPLIAVGIVASVVFVQEGQRRIPIQYAKRMVGRRMTTGGATYLPLRVNMAGVIPVIFAAALLAFPATVAQYFPSTQQFVNDHFQPGNLTYLLTEAALIILFTYFYTAVQFNPVEQADNLRKYGGYIPGIRPGPPTAQYLDRVLTRLTLARFAVPRRRRGRAEHLHQVRRLLAGERESTRRHVRPDRSRCRSRHDASDGEPDDDAELRRLPQIATINVLVLGPQGSGKGTQAKRISAAHGVPHVSTGDMFRAAVADGTELGLQVAPILASGELVPDELTIALIRDRLAQDDAVRGLHPRRVPAQHRPGRGARRDAGRDRTAARRGAVLRPRRRDGQPFGRWDARTRKGGPTTRPR